MRAINSPAGQQPIRVILAQPRGFCAGVVRAIEIVERALEKYGPPIYVRHEIVHNKHVVESLKAKGASTVSRNTGTKIPRRLASDASFLTHSEATDTVDQRTMAHLASPSAFSITSSKDFPKGIFRSHQTDQPRVPNACASSSALFRSSEA